ncbi:unnamed protein product [Fraxinus pennsylvanica]|uniref:Fibronectin type-III domain-containing protein n=1 Tax=Fraxinus pennsylvanica TaxID=56036 RepID=A0AAD2A6T5_9LAMI|nr:unnamed protein product [Fraxinus pennsylvanica]
MEAREVVQNPRRAPSPLPTGSPYPRSGFGGLSGILLLAIIPTSGAPAISHYSCFMLPVLNSFILCAKKFGGKWIFQWLDPSLWLECTSESGSGHSCGLSCHIECALQRGKVGVDLDQMMQLDGSYCCASCGKVSGILGYWKKQLTIAKDARRVDILCSRIFLSYRLLEGTSRFKELHQFIKEAKEKLETEVGPVNDSAKMARGIVSRLSVAGDVQTLCSLAIGKADGWLASKCCTSLNSIESSLPTACKFIFEEITSSSVLVILIAVSTEPFDDIEGYKLWYCMTREETYTKEPVKVFPGSQRRIWISNLQPCTEYSFRIVSFTEAGDLGHSEAKCFTKSNSDYVGRSGAKRECKTVTEIEPDSEFKVQDLGKILRLAWTEEQDFRQGFRGADIKKCSRDHSFIEPKTVLGDRLQFIPREIDLNVSSVPDLNEEFTPQVESSIDNWNHTKTDEGPAVDSHVEVCPKTTHNTNAEMQDSDSNLTNGSPSQVGNVAGLLGENYEYCVKIVRWLECEGHIKEEFRKKFLTWFSLRSTKQECRVVYTFIQTLIDDPSSLAEQLVDSLSEVIAVSGKRPKNGFCGELWH